MNLQNLFNNWAKEAAGQYQDRQWLLSKWDILDGVVWPEEKVNILMDHVYQGLGLDGSGSLLDAGCGGGWLLDRLARSVECAVGCDISLEMLKNASSEHLLLNADACCLPVQDNCFDRVLCYFVLINFMELKDVEKVVREILRVLKPGGRALIGQLPDQSQSHVYDTEKKRYVSYCEKHFDIRANTRDIHMIPIQLFQKTFFTELLDGLSCSYQFLPAFNPFYRDGEPSVIDWRFDIVVDKK